MRLSAGRQGRQSATHPRHLCHPRRSRHRWGGLNFDSPGRGRRFRGTLLHDRTIAVRVGYAGQVACVNQRAPLCQENCKVAILCSWTRRSLAGTRQTGTSEFLRPRLRQTLQFSCPVLQENGAIGGLVICQSTQVAVRTGHWPTDLNCPLGGGFCTRTAPCAVDLGHPDWPCPPDIRGEQGPAPGVRSSPDPRRQGPCKPDRWALN